MVNVLKFRNLLSFCSHKKILVFRAGILCCLPRPFGHATNVRNLRVFMVKTHMISCPSSNIISLLIWIHCVDPDQLPSAYGDHCSGYIYVECFWEPAGHMQMT